MILKSPKLWFLFLACITMAVLDQHNKPEMITFYNETKVRVDALDQKCANFSLARATPRWPMVVFYAMINITVNSKIVYNGVSGTTANRPNYLRGLGIEFCLPYARQQIHNERYTGSNCI